MPIFDAHGKFAGLSRDEKAASVRECLSTDERVTIKDLTSRTGLTVNQVHAGIRHLREVTDCVITERRGPSSTYKLAEDAPEVRAYAERRMNIWRTQIQVIQSEMDIACRIPLPDASVETVRQCISIITQLLSLLDLNDHLNKREQDLVRREAKLNDKNQKLSKVPA